MKRNELPDTCFSILPSTGQLIILKNGEKGYYPAEWDTGNRAKNREIATDHNLKCGISDIQETAMLTGSMFGWTVPGAAPQWYLDQARYVNSSIAKGHIKDPITSIYYPINDFLLRYEIMGKHHFYLPLSALPKELMGARSQYIMQPDLVQGLPFMPVSVSYGENGSCSIQLENGSYLVGESINQEYRITAKVRVGHAEFVIGENDKAPDPFVTWERNCKNDGDGSPNYFWGHYLSERTSAIEDFCDRAKTEFRHQQHQRNQPQRNTEMER